MFDSFETANETANKNRTTFPIMKMPDEILSLIAKACMVPYEIQINEDERHQRYTWVCRNTCRVSFNPPIPDIKFPSIKFMTELRKARPSHFNGHLKFPGYYA